MREGDLDELGCHPEECGSPHPKQRGRSTEVDSEGDAADVAGADGAGKGGGEGLEVAGVARHAALVLLAADDP